MHHGFSSIGVNWDNVVNIEFAVLLGIFVFGMLIGVVCLTIEVYKEYRPKRKR